MRKLVLRKSESHLVPFYDFEDGKKVETEIKLMIDYPTLEQQDILDDLHNEAMKPAIERALELSNGKELTEEEQDKINRECATEIIPSKFREYKRNVIRFCLKGLEGSDIKIELEEKETGSEVKDGILKQLVRDREQADLLYLSIEPEIKFTESDKKK